MSDEEVSGLKKMLEQASGLPWEYYRPHYSSGYYAITSSDGQTVAVDVDEHNAELIVSAVNALSALLDAAAERDALVTKVDRVRALADWHVTMADWARSLTGLGTATAMAKAAAATHSVAARRIRDALNEETRP